MDQLNNNFKRFEFRTVIITLVLSVFYFLWFHLNAGKYLNTGLRTDHFSFYFILVIGYFAHPLTRRLVKGISVFAIFSFLYDSHKIVPNYIFNPVHISEPYYLEKALFGFNSIDGFVTPNEFFSQHNHPILDVLSGFFYLCWTPVPIMLATFLTFTDRRLVLRFSLAFLLVNFLGWVIYYSYPAAAPWYVEIYGFTENFTIPGHVAGLIRFDKFFDIDLFQKMYTKASNVFAALPSLHSAYPVVAFVYGIKSKLGWVNILLGIVMVGIWFAAVYTNHHYIIDVLLGIIVALVGIWIFERVLMKTRLRNWIETWATKI